MSFLAMIEELPAFGEFDKLRNTPAVLFDPKEIVNTIELLWENARKQRFLMEAMEKEMAKRKTETEVRLRTMQNDLEGLIKNEAKKREIGDEAIRADMMKMKEQLHHELKTIDHETRGREADLQRGVDRATGTLRASILDTQGKVSDLGIVVDELKNALDALRASQSNVNMEQVMRAVNEKHSLLCAFIGTSPDTVSASVKSGKEKEVFLKVPALNELAGRIKSVESTANATMKDLRAVESNVADVAKDVSGVKQEVDATQQTIRDTEARITDGYSDGDRKLHRRIDELTLKSSGGLPTVAGSDRSLPVDLSGLTVLRDELGEMAKRIRKVEGEVQDRAHVKDLAAKAGISEIDALWEAVNKLTSITNTHDGDIAELKNRPGRTERVVELGGQRPIEPTPPRDDPRIPEILVRLGDAERLCKHLNDIKADKSEVNAALKDLMKRVEKALNALLARIQDLESSSNPGEATAGRFRCLSCNRNAGPLQEQLNERMSSQQFPPSTVYAQNQRPQSAGVRPSSGIPGMKDYGGGMTSSRKKLMNYYSWLQERADSPGQSTHPEGARERPKSPGLRHPWAGSQSGNGEAGERQCGDHGSAEPEAIGSDGKYYVGVKSRPQSATRRQDANAHM